jgi:hypothetical protein
LSEATSESRRGWAATAYRIALAGGLLAVLAANLPGHMTVDSVVALVEARTDVRQTWAPAVSSWLLRLFDSLVAGTGLYVTASATLLFVSLMSLTALRPRCSWLAVALAVLAIATPQVLIYQGIVWRDVLFANLTIAGFICIAHAASRWVERPILPLLGALICLALAALVRQNGLILVVFAIGVLTWTARTGGRRAGVAWGVGSLLAVAVLALTINQVAQPATALPGLRTNAAALILKHYDIIGAKAHHPKLRMTAIAKADPTAAAYLEANANANYSAARVDRLDADETFRKTLWHVPDAAMNAQWIEVITGYPAAYVLQRGDVFRWVFLTPQIEACLPVTTGVEGPEGMLASLDIGSGRDVTDLKLLDYAKRFYRTPVFSHLTWAVVAAAVIALLARRRDPADWVFIALLGGTLAFVASFALISVACDYRYLYLLDLAAMVGLIYTALDPPWRRRSLSAR